MGLGAGPSVSLTNARLSLLELHLCNIQLRVDIDGTTSIATFSGPASPARESSDNEKRPPAEFVLTIRIDWRRGAFARA